MSEKVLHVRHVFLGVHSYRDVSPAEQLFPQRIPLHASYVRHVSNGTIPSPSQTGTRRWQSRRGTIRPPPRRSSG